VYTDDTYADTFRYKSSYRDTPLVSMFSVSSVIAIPSLLRREAEFLRVSPEKSVTSSKVLETAFSTSIAMSSASPRSILPDPMLMLKSSPSSLLAVTYSFEKSALNEAVIEVTSYSPTVTVIAGVVFVVSPRGYVAAAVM